MTEQVKLNLIWALVFLLALYAAVILVFSAPEREANKFRVKLQACLQLDEQPQLACVRELNDEY